MVSSEIPEVLGLADRVLVIAEGRVMAEETADALDEHRVLDLVMQGTTTHGVAPELHHTTGVAQTQHEGTVA